MLVILSLVQNSTVGILREGSSAITERTSCRHRAKVEVQRKGTMTLQVNSPKLVMPLNHDLNQREE